MYLAIPFILALLAESSTISKKYSPEASAAFSRGCYHSALHDCERAIGYWEEALRLEPNYWESHIKMADCFLTLKQPEKAIEHISKARTTNPDAGTALLERAGREESAPPQKSDKVLWTLSPLEAELQEMAVSLWSQEEARRPGTPTAQSYTKVDPVSGNVYRITKNPDGTVDERGSNPTTGANWTNHFKPDGSSTGTDKDGNAWFYDAKSSVYMNSNGTRCVGNGAERLCRTR